MKVVINVCFGGFSLSDAAAEECIRRGMTVSKYDANGMMVNPSADFSDNEGKGHYGRYYAPNGDTKEFRCHPTVVAVVEELGDKANGSCAELKVIDIPFDSTEGWHIDEYDGNERIAQDHQTWG